MQSEAPEHNNSVVHTQKWQQGWSGQASEVLLASSQSSSESVVRHCVLAENYVNGRSNHGGYLLSLFCVFFLFVDSKALDAVWTILVRVCPCIYCDVEYIGFGRCVWCLFSGAGAATCATKTASCPSHVQQRCTDPNLKQLIISSVYILAVALELANGSECID